MPFYYFRLEALKSGPADTVQANCAKPGCRLQAVSGSSREDYTQRDQYLLNGGRFPGTPDSLRL